MPQRPVQASNAILVGGNPIYEEYEVETATDMYPGRAVIAGTNPYQIKVGTDNDTTIIGVLDVKPDGKRTDQYSASDQARVIRGDAVVMMLKASGANIAKGGKVQCAGSGKIDQYATANADIGIAEEAKSGDDDEWIIVKLTNV